MNEFGPLPKGAHCIGKPCHLCKKKLEVGDIGCLIPRMPTDQEEADKMRAGIPYTTEAELVHKKCKEKLDMFMQD